MTYSEKGPAILRDAAGTIGRNFLSLTVGRFGSQLIGLATNAYLGRRISVDGFGAVGLAQAVTTYLNIFSDAGLSVVAIREAAQCPDRLQQLIRSISALRLILAVGCTAMGLACASVLPFSETSRLMVCIFALSLPLQAVVVDWVFRALQKMHFSSVLQLLGAVVTLVLTVAMVRSPSHAVRVPLVNLVVAAVSAYASVRLLGRVGLGYGLTFDLHEFRAYLAASLPLCVSSLAITLYIQANYLILGAVCGEHEVGLYAASAKLTSGLSTLHWLYYVAMAPTLMGLYAYSREGVAALLRQSLRVTSALGLGVAVVGIAAGGQIMRAIFGRSFGMAGPVFSMMVLSAAVVAFGHNWAQLVIAAKRERLLLASAIAGGICNLSVCTMLVKPFGALGAAVANLSAEVVVHLSLLYYCARHLCISEVEATLGPVLSAGAALTASAVLRAWPAGRLLAACTVYFVFLLLTGALRPRDLGLLRGSVLAEWDKSHGGR